MKDEIRKDEEQKAVYHRPEIECLGKLSTLIQGVSGGSLCDANGCRSAVGWEEE